MVEYNVDKERIDDFIMAYGKSDEDLEILKEYATHHDVPIIRDDTKDFLTFLLKAKRPKSVLELGTAIAYSTLVIYKALDKDVDTIVTVENYDKRIEIAESNIKKYFDEGKVSFIKEDITIYLKNIKQENVFDFVFLDAAKAQYIIWLPYIKKLMKKDAILVADNIFKDGEMLESKYAILKRDRTIHKRMREFLHEIMTDKDFDSNILNIGDGISVSIKK